MQELRERPVDGGLYQLQELVNATWYFGLINNPSAFVVLLSQSNVEAIRAHHYNSPNVVNEPTLIEGQLLIRNGLLRNFDSRGSYWMSNNNREHRGGLQVPGVLTFTLVAWARDVE